MQCQSQFDLQLGAKKALLGDTTIQLGAKMAARRPNLEPKWPRDLPTWSQNGAQDFQLGAKMPPKSPSPIEGAHKTSNLERLGAILAPSWWFWGPFWLQVGGLGRHFGPKLGGLGAMLAPSWGVLALSRAFLGPS